MDYVDGFVMAVPRRKLKDYKRLAQRAGKIWKEYGALQYRECTGDDLKVKGFGLAFPKLIKQKPGEVVVFSWITYKSKGQRSRIMKKVMEDPRLADMMDPDNMPFDMKRMAYGGFKTIVSY
jgi:uncharacterized protein YbaA (DUF1428 family)